ncbi:MAG: hypothetical protein QM762_12585 [Chryseolinea sp.]
MTSADKKKLETRRKKLEAVIAQQFTIRKEMRDQKLIDDTRVRIAKIDEWLGTPKTKKRQPKEPPKKDISKKEFKRQLNEILETPEPMDVMHIDTIDELTAAWPKIRGRNIQIEGPKFVLQKARELTRQDIAGRRKK